MSTSAKKSKPLFLFCGKGVNATFPSNPLQVLVPINSSVRIAQVRVNTRGMDRPVIQIEFSSIVNVLAIDDDVVGPLSFLLFRACDDDEPVLVNTWPYEVFEIEDINNIRLSTSFVFNFCECLNTSGCFEYFVEVFVGGSFEAKLLVNNVQITALAVESGC